MEQKWCKSNAIIIDQEKNDDQKTQHALVKDPIWQQSQLNTWSQDLIQFDIYKDVPAIIQDVTYNRNDCSKLYYGCTNFRRFHQDHLNFAYILCTVKCDNVLFNPI